MKWQGNIRKMTSELQTPVRYELPVGKERVPISEHIGHSIRMEYSGQIHCIACGRKTNKSFNQGYCYPCMRSLAECDICIVRPEQCHFDQGTCRDEGWALNHCMQDHIVYLANSSGLKVGITRHSQIPTRWIDQGAAQALPILKVNNRYLSGLVEAEIKQHMSDRTDWRKMLKSDAEPIDLLAKRLEILEQCADPLEAIASKVSGASLIPDTQTQVTEIKFPVQQYPEKVKALNFDKTPVIESQLMGIKGQYLILETGVVNMRKFAGYEILVEF